MPFIPLSSMVGRHFYEGFDLLYKPEKVVRKTK